MSKELVIGSNRHETKVAVLEEDQLVEVYFQRGDEYSLAGSIHKGRVTRVLPGMQSAFVNLGLERDTFLYVSDFFEEHDDIDTVDEKPSRNEGRERGQRGDRRDRGQQQRGGERSAEAPGEQDSREQRVQTIAPVFVTPESADADAEDVEAVGTPETASSNVESAAGNRTGERPPEGDRQFRGDRRGGRRSRRRPRGGRGIPENKYAQPSGLSFAPSQQEETIAAPDEEGEPERRSERIILPGESLAKYRGVTPERHASETQDYKSQDFKLDAPLHEKELTDHPGHNEVEGDRTAAENIVPETVSEADIEAQAEEINFAGKVFGHQNGEVEPPPSDEVEIPKAEPAASFVVSDMDPGEEEHLLSPTPQESHAPDFSHESVSSPVAERALPIEDAVPPTESAAAEERAHLAESVVEELHAEALSDAIEEEESEVSEGDEAVAPDATVQTAEVRDQGGRSMHRMSRRMRRRRGGNRFHRDGQDNAGSNGSAGTNVEAAGPAVAGSSNIGAAVAQDARAAEGRSEASREERGEERSAERPERVLPSITDLLKPGQEIIVQIAKEPLGQKGARITSHIALPGRFVVFMPSVNHLGVSRKIASDEERQRLKRILQTHRVGTTGGFIVRTAGEGIPEDEIAADMNFLYSLWLDIRQKAEKKPAPTLLHYDLDVVQRILRDQVTEDFKAIWVDNEQLYESVLSFMQRFQPAFVNRVKMYTRSAPIFDAFNITQELEKALRPKVWLKSGGYIVINQTEALVAIDINTGKYVGKTGRLEDTIVKTNTEAVKEIVRQIRLRDLGGIIVVDFIDMDERKNRQKVMQALEEAMEADKAPYKILQFNDFGLVAITRKRVKQSLERTLCAPCPYCEGAGYVKSVQTIIGEILVEAQKIAKAIDGKDVMLRVHPEVAKVLKASDNKYLEELEEVLGKPVLVKSDLHLHHEKFDLA